MKRVLLSLVACVAVIAAFASGIKASSKPNDKAKAKAAATEAVLIGAEDLKWVEVAEAPGVSEAVAWGDAAKGAYGALVKFKAGLEVPLHTHTHDSKGVVVSGTMEITLDGKPAKTLASGSYLVVPGKMKHVTRCVGDQDCVFFVEQPGKSDVIMVEKAAASE